MEYYVEVEVWEWVLIWKYIWRDFLYFGIRCPDSGLIKMVENLNN